MEFCPKCKSILAPGKGKLVCACGYEKKSGVSFKEKVDHKDLVVIDEENEHLGDAMIDEKCFACGNVGVYFWLVQTRRSDEPPTRFYRCKKCRKVWRAGG